MRRYHDHERPLPPQRPAQCYDCGFPYTHPAWIEAVVDNSVWEIINPTYHKGAGLLCINCIAKRCAQAGLQNVRVMLTAGPLVFDPLPDAGGVYTKLLGTR